MQNKNAWRVVIALLALTAAIGAERLSSMRMNQMIEVKKEVDEKVSAYKARVDQKEKEIAVCQAALDQAVCITSAVRWETDPTNVIRSMSEMASQCGVQLTSAELIKADRVSGAVLDNKFGRMRYEATIKGRYKGVVRFMDAIEHSKNVMLIDKMTLTASRQEAGVAEARLTVSSLHRLPDAPPAESATDKTTVAKGGESKP